MFSETIKRISSIFVDEAKHSPQLLSDMAKMEYYMAESYSGRVFVELLQNADDAGSTKVCIYQNKNTLFFANNGKPFDENDLMAISRSGASGKERGKTIGYRGVGFKSASSISNEILIFSNNICFSFSKRLCAELLGFEEKNVPTIRIPLLVENVSENIRNDVDSLLREGYTTVFAFVEPNLDQFYDELSTIESGHFLFLNNILECKTNLSPDAPVTYSVTRENLNDSIQVIIKTNQKTKEWLLVKRDSVMIAFAYENGIIVPCSDSEAVYHCYLPTLDKAIIPCKINGDFSTDPSRKHLSFDQKTKSVLDQVTCLLFDVLKIAVSCKELNKYKNTFSMFLHRSALSKANCYVDSLLEKEITINKWLPLSDGKCISPVEYKTMPNALEIENSGFIRIIPTIISSESMSPDVYKRIDAIEDFLGQYSRAEFDIDIIAEMLSSVDFVRTINSEIYVQLLIGTIREQKVRSRLNPNAKITIDTILIKDSSQKFLPLSEFKRKSLQIDTELRKELTERLGESEIMWLQENTDVRLLDVDLHSSESCFAPLDFENKRNSVTLSPHISKWRNAESKCIEIEELMGNSAIDVSVKNVGYDVFSTTNKGEPRYIEVKSVKKDFAFSLTNNEYTAAHEYGCNYFICLICENENTLEVRYISNPLSNAHFEKRIRQWEWICLDFEATPQYYDIS